MSVRPSLPYQGIARRALVENLTTTYNREIDVSAVMIKETKMKKSEPSSRIEELRAFLRARLGDTGSRMIDQQSRLKTPNKIPFVFSDEQLDKFLELAQIGPSATSPTDYVVSRAYIYALMAQTPQEAGREFCVVDNGVEIDPPNVSDKLLELIRLEMRLREI